MAKVKKYKKMTQAEKKFRKELREELRADGIIPPVKPRLNRKKFLQDVQEEFKLSVCKYDDVIYLHEAISWFIPSLNFRKITPEEIGVLKMMKIAIELKKFYEEKLNQGERKYKPSEVYEKIVLPIKEM
jgi:hypothetical protein